jgi:hypothetical protein
MNAEFIFATVGGRRDKKRYGEEVVVFKLNDSGGYSESQRLKLPAKFAGSFGYSLYVFNGRLVVSALAYPTNSADKKPTEVAFIYSNTNGVWVLSGSISGSDLGSQYKLERVEAISKDEVIISGTFQDPNAEVWFCTITARDEKGKIIGQSKSKCKSFKRRLFVYREQNGAWKLSQVIEPWLKGGTGEFGKAVTLNDEYLIVGASTASLEGSPSLAGAVWVYKKEANAKYEPHRLIKPKNQHYAQMFGSDLAMNEEYLVVGAKEDKRNAYGLFKMDRTGGVYLFELEDGEFVERQKFVAGKRQKMGYFGRSVALGQNFMAVGSGGKQLKSRAFYHDEGMAYWVSLKQEELDVPKVPEYQNAPIAVSGEIARKQIATLPQIKVYPNPSKGRFTLEKRFENSVHITLLSLDGKEIMQMDMDNEVLNLDLSFLKKGVYILKMERAHFIQTEKLILID